MRNLTDEQELEDYRHLLLLKLSKMENPSKISFLFMDDLRLDS